MISEDKYSVISLLCTSTKMISGAITLFLLAASLSMASASFTLPWDRSQRGDSGINLHKKILVWNKSVVRSCIGTVLRSIICNILYYNDYWGTAWPVVLCCWQLPKLTTREGCRSVQGQTGWPRAFSSHGYKTQSGATSCSQWQSISRHQEMSRGLSQNQTESLHLSAC